MNTTKPTINKPKGTDLISWLILIIILFLSSFIVWQLHTLKEDLMQNDSTSKIRVIDLNELDELCGQFMNQWNAENYIIYIYQPNSIRKTHKELASTSFDADLPIRLEFQDSEQLKGNNIVFGLSENLPFGDKIDTKKNKYYIVVPILNYNIVNSEIYIFFDEEQSQEKQKNYMSESQVINKMLY